MADETPTEAVPMWVKDPATGKVGSIHTPEDIAAARANGFVDASSDEVDKAHRAQVMQGTTGKVAAGVSGLAQVVPFSHQLLTPGLARDVGEASDTHPIIHAASEVAGIAATAGTGAVGGIDAAGEAAGQLAERAVAKTIETAGEEGAAKAIPSLAQRVLGRMANNATQGAGYAGLELTNETDLPHDPAELAEHILSTGLLGAAGGVAGGELAHAALKGASKLASVGSKLMGKANTALTDLSEGFRAGDDPSKLARKHAPAIQNALDSVDKSLKDLAPLSNKIEQKAPEAIAEADRLRIQAEDKWAAAKANVMRLAAGPENVAGSENAVRRIKVGKILKALKADDAGRDEIVESLKGAAEAGQQVHDLHEKFSQAAADGTEGFKGKAADQMQELIEAHDDIKKGLQQQATGGAGPGLGTLGAVAELAGHHVLGGLGIGAAVAKKAWELAPAEFKANMLAKLAKVSAGVEAHLGSVANATVKGTTGSVVGGVTAMTLAQWKAEKERVNAASGNPQLAMDHLENKAGAVADYAPQTYSQLGIALGRQYQMIGEVLNAGPSLPGYLSPAYQPSATELAKMGQAVAVIKDPRVAEAAFARGAMTPAMAAAYAKAWPKRSHSFSVKVGSVLAEEKHRDQVTMKAAGSMGSAGLGLPRASLSQHMIAGTQSLYALRATQRGGTGSRGGTSGASHISSATAIQLPGQRVSQRPVK